MGLAAAAVAAPQFFGSIARHVSILDEGPEEGRAVESREAIDRGESMFEEPLNKENQEGVPRAEEEQYRKNGEAKFAFPEGSNEGIGYYFEGEQVSPDEFGRLVAEKADRIREKGDE